MPRLRRRSGKCVLNPWASITPANDPKNLWKFDERRSEWESKKFWRTQYIPGVVPRSTYKTTKTSQWIQFHLDQGLYHAEREWEPGQYPVIMRGSRIIMVNAYNTQSSYACKIVDRFVKAKRITATSRSEWDELAAKILTSLQKRWDRYNGSDYVWRHVSEYVSRLVGRYQILLDGEQIWLDDDKRAQIESLDTIRKKLDMVNL